MIADVRDPDSAEAVRETIERYNEAWNHHDIDTILTMHAPDFVFHNHTAGERVEGDEVREHISRIFQNTPTLRFTGRRLYAREGLVVNEWTAHAEREGRQVEWDGVDVLPFENGLIKRKDVYSGSNKPRMGDGAAGDPVSS
jgi:ketosteroid isomerase-like protein